MAGRLLVAGGGIAGLSAALAAQAAGWSAHVLEQAAAFSEVGAGLQLGPNATRLLQRWPAVSQDTLRPAHPDRLQVRDAIDGRELAVLRLGATAQARHGAPYWTVHRADLQAALLAACAAQGVALEAGCQVVSVDVAGAQAALALADGRRLEGQALAVADGVWSTLRPALVGGGPAPPTGHVAYRALVPMRDLPAPLRAQEVQAWLGPGMHLVRYPVRAGEAMNVVAFVEGGAARGWDEAASAEPLLRRAQGLCGDLRTLVDLVPAWRAWPVHDRVPVRSAREVAVGRAVLLGDAAHPMRPYLAQGAGMAIEDAWVLQQALAGCDAAGVPSALQRFAQARWARCARVQARSRRNGRVFHADGWLRWARNLALRVGGERVVDLPWLYAGGPR